jgi:alkanesulfonate monooxygenase SsuD/methylene tetrahydromethanopterin reductase-like flavin-dependent oxidoreductase (luciferase family)
VTSSDAFTGENFRRGAYLPYDQRYERGEQFVAAVNAMWDSWSSAETPGRFRHDGTQVQLDGHFTVPLSPQGRPVMLQAGDSDAGREFAARHADGIFTRHGKLEDGLTFYADVKGRLARYGRRPEDLVIMPGSTFIIGDTDDEALEIAREVRRAQVSGPHAIMFLEQLWNRDLSDYDPDGPLPDVDPDVDSEARAQGSAQARTLHREALETAARWRAHAEAGGLSIRDLAIEMTGRQSFIGSPETIAATMTAYVQSEACDGFILIPHITPGGLDRFVDDVVPLLQERGSFREEYTGATLREHLGLRPSPSPKR